MRNGYVRIPRGGAGDQVSESSGSRGVGYRWGGDVDARQVELAAATGPAADDDRNDDGDPEYDGQSRSCSKPTSSTFPPLLLRSPPPPPSPSTGEEGEEGGQ